MRTSSQLAHALQPLPPHNPQHVPMRSLWIATCAFAFWGLFPLFWKQFTGISPWETLAHRICWSMVWMLAWIMGSQQLGALWQALCCWRTVGPLAISGSLIGLNWGLYIEAVGEGRILETSLGSFMTPLMTIVLGVWWFRERLSRAQWIAIVLACIGVGVLALRSQSLSAFVVLYASTFAIYGAIRKHTPISPLLGTCIETIIIAPFAAGYLLLLAQTHALNVLTAPRLQQGLLVSTGIVTVLPLLMFSLSTRQLPLFAVGLLQFISPTLQFILAVWVYGEPCDATKLASFGWIWAAIAMFMWDLWTRARRSRAIAAATQS